MILISTKKFNNFSQENYDKTVSSINLYSVKCTCGCFGCLEKHGHYTRSVRFKSMRIRILVQRVRCKICGRTHAILLSFFVPYSQIPLDDQINIIIYSENKAERDKILEENNLIDDCEVYRIIANFKKHWKERLLSLETTFNDDVLTKKCINSNLLS